MRLALCLLALAVLLAPTTTARPESCDVVEITGDLLGVVVEPNCLPPAEAIEAKAAECDPIHIYTNPPDVTVEPECIV